MSWNVRKMSGRKKVLVVRNSYCTITARVYSINLGGTIIYSSGYCSDIRNMAQAVKHFQPIYFRNVSTADILTVLLSLADKLKFFCYYQVFSERFISYMKQGIPKVEKEKRLTTTFI